MAHQETVGTWATPVLGLIGLVVGVPMGIWRLVLADRRDRREGAQRREERETWQAEQYERRLKRFARAADRLLNREGIGGEHGLDETLALLEIEAIADADKRGFLRQAKEVVRRLDHQWRFPSKEEMEEYEKITHKIAAEMEMEDASEQGWKEYHHPYRDDEPRISGIDLSFERTLRRLVQKWGSVPRKKKDVG